MDDLSGSTPAADYIYVVDVEEETASGLIVPHEARKSGHIWGEVIAQGQGRWSEASGTWILFTWSDPEVGYPDKIKMAAMPCEVGDSLYYSVGCGSQNHTMDGQKVRIIRPHDIVARK